MERAAIQAAASGWPAGSSTMLTKRWDSRSGPPIWSLRTAIVRRPLTGLSTVSTIVSVCCLRSKSSRSRRSINSAASTENNSRAVLPHDLRALDRHHEEDGSDDDQPDDGAAIAALNLQPVAIR